MDSKTSSGRRIDGIIQPVAPGVAGHQNKFQYYSYSAVANVLDFSAAVLPVSPGFTLAEMASEEVHSRPASNEEDERVQRNCKYALLEKDGPRLILQLLQTALQTRKTCQLEFRS